MLYGHLSDPSQEYFIQPKEQSSSSPAPASLFSNSHYLSSTSPFDWYHSYYINYSLVPDTLISPSLAVQVLFAGKVVQLLSKFQKESPQSLSTKYQSSHVGSRPGSPSKRETTQSEEISELDGIYDYFTSSRGKGGLSFERKVSEEEKERNESRDDDEDSVHEQNSSTKPKDQIRCSIIDQYTTKDNSSLPYQDIFHLPEYLERIWNESLPFPSFKASSSSLGLEYLKSIHQNYQKAILSWDPNLIREEIENLIHQLYQQSSNELWNEMTKGQEIGQQQEEQKGKQERRITIYQQLEFMRNTYLCGKGEFYQVGLIPFR